MRLWVINPNATEAMTETIAAAAREVAAPGLEIVARTNRAGPPAIQGPEDGAAAVPGLLGEIARGEAEGADAYVIACFDDTGLAAARAATGRPVIGIGQAGCGAAALLGRYSVVTTLAVSVPVIEANLAAAGLLGVCVRVRASGAPVLSLEDDPDAAERAVAAEVARAVAEDAPAAVVLGCAGMARLGDGLGARFGVPVIDGVRAAVLIAGLARRPSGG
jgi:allantoin racemase